MPIRNLSTIAITFLKGSFIFELLPLIPLQFLELNGEEQIFYIVKIMRIFIGLDYADPSAITQKLQSINLNRIKNLIESNPDLANSCDYDQTYLKYLMVLKYALSSIKLAFTILTFSYFLGVIWYIFSIEMYYFTRDENATLDPAIYNTETFITTNDLDLSTSSRTNQHNMALLMYFSYTTLSTVGFGDFNPRSDYERLLCILILLLGVAIFGLILGNF